VLFDPSAATGLDRLGQVTLGTVRVSSNSTCNRCFQPGKGLFARLNFRRVVDMDILFFPPDRRDDCGANHKAAAMLGEGSPEDPVLVRLKLRLQVNRAQAEPRVGGAV
jgi:hypothetical protein